MQGMLHEKKTKEGPEEEGRGGGGERVMMWKKKLELGETRPGRDLLSLLMQGLTKEDKSNEARWD